MTEQGNRAEGRIHSGRLYMHGSKFGDDYIMEAEASVKTGDVAITFQLRRICGGVRLVYMRLRGIKCKLSEYF